MCACVWCVSKKLHNRCSRPVDTARCERRRRRKRRRRRDVIWAHARPEASGGKLQRTSSNNSNKLPQ